MYTDQDDQTWGFSSNRDYNFGLLNLLFVIGLVFYWTSLTYTWFFVLYYSAVPWKRNWRTRWLNFRYVCLVFSVLDFFPESPILQLNFFLQNLCRPWEEPSIKNIVRLLRDASLQVGVVYLLVVVFQFECRWFIFLDVELILCILWFSWLSVTGARADEEVIFLPEFSLMEANMCFRSFSSNHLTMYRQLTD